MSYIRVQREYLGGSSRFEPEAAKTVRCCRGKQEASSLRFAVVTGVEERRYLDAPANCVCMSSTRA